MGTNQDLQKVKAMYSNYNLSASYINQNLQISESIDGTQIKLFYNPWHKWSQQKHKNYRSRCS